MEKYDVENIQIQKKTIDGASGCVEIYPSYEEINAEKRTWINYSFRIKCDACEYEKYLRTQTKKCITFSCSAGDIDFNSDSAVIKEFIQNPKIPDVITVRIQYEIEKTPVIKNQE
jgi:hypothetical protein